MWRDNEWPKPPSPSASPKRLNLKTFGVTRFTKRPKLSSFTPSRNVHRLNFRNSPSLWLSPLAPRLRKTYTLYSTCTWMYVCTCSKRIRIPVYLNTHGGRTKRLYQKTCNTLCEIIITLSNPLITQFSSLRQIIVKYFVYILVYLEFNVLSIHDEKKEKESLNIQKKLIHRILRPLKPYNFSIKQFFIRRII